MLIVNVNLIWFYQFLWSGISLILSRLRWTVLNKIYVRSWFAPNKGSQPLVRQETEKWNSFFSCERLWGIKSNQSHLLIVVHLAARQIAANRASSLLPPIFDAKLPICAVNRSSVVVPACKEERTATVCGASLLYQSIAVKHIKTAEARRCNSSGKENQSLMADTFPQQVYWSLLRFYSFKWHTPGTAFQASLWKIIPLTY